MQRCGAFLEILHNKLEAIAKKIVIFFFPLFLTPSPYNFIILQPFITGEPYFIIFIFSKCRECVLENSRAKTL